MNKKRLSTWICGFYAFSLLLVGLSLVPGFADENTEKTPEDFRYCDDLCGIIVNSNSHKIMGLDGSDGWKSSDDPWCSAHLPSALNQSSGTSSPTTSPSPGSTSIIHASVSDTSAPSCSSSNSTGCHDFGDRIARCRWHGTQVESQCLAYDTAEKSGKGEHVVLALDIVAAATCATACFGGKIIPGVTAACQIASLSAGGGEIYETFKLKNSPAGKIVNGLAAGVGIGAGAISLAKGGFDGKTTGQRGNAKKESCIAAIAFGALTGLRAHSIHSHDHAKEKACIAIKKLASEQPTASPSPTGQAGPGTMVIYQPGPPAGVGGGTGVIGGGTSANGNGGAGAGNARQTLSCIEGSGIQNCASEHAAATDSKILENSGLDKIAAPLAQQLDLDQLKKNLEKNGAGGALSGALGPGSGAFGQGIATLAQAVQDEASKNLSDGVPGSGYASNGGGGSGATGGKSDHDLSALSSILNGDRSGAGVGTPSEQNFAASSEGEETDIWHTKSKLTLFEIVSKRMTKVTPRVDRSPFLSN